MNGLQLRTKNKIYDDLTSTLVDTETKIKLSWETLTARQGRIYIMKKQSDTVFTSTRKRNDNGEKLIKVALEIKLTITHGKYKRNSQRKWTLRPPDKNTNTTNSYISYNL